MLTLELADEAATVGLGAALAAAIGEIPGGLIVYLQGDLGAGKTTLCRGLLQALGHRGAVKSPTYTLVETYSLNTDVLGALTLHHFDLYRLHDPEELEFMGIRDYFGAGIVALVEWPQRGDGYFPGPDLVISLAPKDVGRTATVAVNSVLGQALADRLKISLKCQPYQQSMD
jgi:tRNA threonylcarbamoyladenosine biosynthesis protein TsaE